MRVKKRLSEHNIQNQTKNDFTALDSYQMNCINVDIRKRPVKSERTVMQKKIDSKENDK